MPKNTNKPAILCVANWPSDVGYAWWLMESYWAKISQIYVGHYRTLLAYPEINTIPDAILNSPIECLLHKFEANNLLSVFANVKLIKQHNIKVLYLSDFGVAGLAYLAYRLAGVDVIITHDHTPGLRTRVSGIKRWIKKLFVQNSLLGADAAFGATEFVSRRLVETACMKQSKCFTIPNGIAYRPMQCVAPPHHLMAKLPSDKTIIVTAARANRYKGAEFAINVIAELVHKRGRSDFIYVFCGDGPDLNTFEERVKAEKLDAVCFFPGRVNNIGQFLNSCHIGFQPSLGEVGYSLSIIEYMAAKMPVIVPDNPSVCGATEHNKTGFIYPENDTSAAADAFCYYLDHAEKRIEHGERALEIVVAQYTLEASHKALSDAMRALVTLV